MYAQIIEGQSSLARLVELERLVRRELLPALRVVSGFCGAVSLVKRERGDALLVLLWETEDEAVHAFASASSELREAFASWTELLGPPSAAIWEVNARS